MGSTCYVQNAELNFTKPNAFYFAGSTNLCDCNISADEICFHTANFDGLISMCDPSKRVQLQQFVRSMI